MPEKQIHELEPVAAPTPDDMMLVSSANGQKTGRTVAGRLQVRLDRPSASSRELAQKLAERISVSDFGAVGDGLSDDTLAFYRAFASGAAEIIVPEGRYRLSAELLVPARTRLIGAASSRSVLVADHFDHVLRCEALAELGVQLERLGFELTNSTQGLLMTGNHCSLRDLQFSGGSPSSWAVDLVDANNVELSNIRVGGVGTNVFFGNGIRWRNGDPAHNPSNYGNGLLQAIDIRLGNSDVVGIHLQGESSRLITNVLLEKVRVSAPMAGSTPFVGSVGIKLDSCVRTTLQSVDLEALAVGVQEFGISNGLGACVANQYIGVYAINVTTSYVDSNATVSRSVQQRTFLGCDNFPATVGLDDGDTVVPAGFWLQSFVYGENAVRLRCFSGHELILDDGEEPGSLGFDVGGSSPRIAPKQTGNVVRLYLGRGSSPTNNTMRDVTIEPVLRLAPRDSQNPATTTGQMVYADGVNWDPGHGEGFYFFERGSWRKVMYEV